MGSLDEQLIKTMKQRGDRQDFTASVKAVTHSLAGNIVSPPGSDNGGP